MINKSFLVLLLGFGVFLTSSANAQMQQGYENDQPSVSVDRSALEDLKGYQPPPMFGADLMPPPTNRLSTPKVESQKSVVVTSPSQPPVPAPAAVVAPATPTMTAPNAEALLNHPTQNFHVLTERNASMTTPDGPVDSPNGPLLPLPDDEYSPAVKAKAAQEKADKQKPAKKEVVKKETKKESKKDDKKKADKKKDEPKKADVKKADVKKDKPVEPTKPVAEEKKAGLVATPDPSTVKSVTIEPPKMIQPNPNAYRPQAPQSMPAVPPIKVEKNALPPLSGSPLPSLPPTTDTTEKIEKPSVGVRMMDAALERQMESDETKIKEQLAETNIKTVAPGTETAKAVPKTAVKKTERTLVFGSNDLTITNKMKAQIKSQILPEIEKDKKSRIQIISFATAPDKSEESARRISLLRSLAVRDYLKDLKIDTSRMDVRALPSDGNTTPPDKVDIVLLK